MPQGDILRCAWQGGAWAAILPPSSRRDQDRRRGAESGLVWAKGVQDRRGTGGPLAPSSLQASPAEKRVAVPWIGHTADTVCQASRGAYMPHV